MTFYILLQCNNSLSFDSTSLTICITPPVFLNCQASYFLSAIILKDFFGSPLCLKFYGRVFKSKEPFSCDVTSYLSLDNQDTKHFVLLHLNSFESAPIRLNTNCCF